MISKKLVAVFLISESLATNSKITYLDCQLRFCAVMVENTILDKSL